MLSPQEFRFYHNNSLVSPFPRQQLMKQTQIRTKSGFFRISDSPRTRDTSFFVLKLSHLPFLSGSNSILRFSHVIEKSAMFIRCDSSGNSSRSSCFHFLLFGSSLFFIYIYDALCSERKKKKRRVEFMGILKRNVSCIRYLYIDFQSSKMLKLSRKKIN